MAEPFDSIPGAPLSLPVDDRVVALVRLPVSLTNLPKITAALVAEHGDDLVIRTDTGIAGWVVLSRPKAEDPPQT